MNEHELTLLVDSVLGYACSHRRRGTCQPVNHTWLRRDGDGPYSRLFIERAGENPQGVIALNIPKGDVEEFDREVKMAKADSRLDDSRPKRFSRYVLRPTADHVEFLKTWVARTVN